MDSENSAPSPPPQPAPHDPEKSERDWAMFTHLSGLCCLMSIPSLIGPLILWLMKKDEMPKVDRAGKEALNFHLTILIIEVISIPLMFIGIGFLTLIAAAFISIIFSIIAGVEASKGVDYVYPLSFKFVN